MAELGARPRKSAQAKPVESVLNAAKILEMLAGASLLRVSDVASNLSVSVSTAHRLLSSLELAGFLEQDPVSRCYSSGRALGKLVGELGGGLDLISFAQPFIEALCLEVQETACLATLDGTEIVFLHTTESKQYLRVGAGPGNRLPAHATSIGKAMLATLSDAEICERYPESLTGGGSIGVFDRERLLEELAVIRQNGHSTSIGEVDLDVGSIGAAVPVAPGQQLLAVAIAVPSTRFDQKMVDVNAERVIHTAVALGRQLKLIKM